MPFREPRKWPWVLVSLALIVFAVKNPEVAAHLTKTAGGWVSAIATGMGRFASDMGWG